jgi:hypothetical protein
MTTGFRPLSAGDGDPIDPDEAGMDVTGARGAEEVDD